MDILFTKHNVTIHPYLEVLGKTHNVVVFHHKQAHTPVPKNCKEHRVVYRPRFIADLFVRCSVSLMYPQYVRDMFSQIEIFSPSSIFISDISHFIFAQTVYYKHRYPNTKLYLWSETRQWPHFWLSRWMMYGFWWYFKRNAKYVEKVFVFTEEGRRFFNTHAPDVSVVVLPAPVDTKLFYAETSKEYVPGGVLRIIMNARYIPLKEHRTFFEALILLKKKQIDFSISLIGRGGHTQTELKEYAEQLGIAQYITWLDPVSIEKLRAIYSAHDVLVLPSNREAIGMVVPEAMACGLATVTSQAVGANTYVEEGKTGFIFETGNAEALADALEQLAHESVVSAFGQTAAQVIQERYSVEVLGEKLLRELN